jgi:hypothetical protein
LKNFARERNSQGSIDELPVLWAFSSQRPEADANPSCNGAVWRYFRSDSKMDESTPGTLTTFCETTEMTGHASFLEADGLSTFRTSLSKEAVFVFEAAHALAVFEVSIFQNSANGIWYGQNQTVLLKDGMLSSNAF